MRVKRENMCIHKFANIHMQVYTKMKLSITSYDVMQIVCMRAPLYKNHVLRHTSLMSSSTVNILDLNGFLWHVLSKLNDGYAFLLHDFYCCHVVLLPHQQLLPRFRCKWKINLFPKIFDLNFKQISRLIKECDLCVALETCINPHWSNYY